MKKIIFTALTLILSQTCFGSSLSMECSLDLETQVIRHNHSLSSRSSAKTSSFKESFSNENLGMIKVDSNKVTMINTNSGQYTGINLKLTVENSNTGVGVISLNRGIDKRSIVVDLKDDDTYTELHVLKESFQTEIKTKRNPKDSTVIKRKITAVCELY